MLIAACCFVMPLAVSAQDVDVCNGCHRDTLSLEAWDTAELAAKIREMRDGDIPHIVPIPALDNAQIDALADALTNP
jgi:hypothetical protein